MAPFEFITDCGDDYNAPVGAVIEALKNPLKILSGPGEDFVVLSYYYSHKDKCMVLDIERKEC
jgi:hypothetical protein